MKKFHLLFPSQSSTLDHRMEGVRRALAHPSNALADLVWDTWLDAAETVYMLHILPAGSTAATKIAPK